MRDTRWCLYRRTVTSGKGTNVGDSAPPRDDARPPHWSPARRYLRPATPDRRLPGPSPIKIVPFARLIPAFVLFTIVGVVLLGGGFWSAGQHVGVPDMPMETINVSPDQATDTAPIPASVPGGDVIANPSVNAADLTATNYLPRPARTITSPSQRIDVVRARRDQTLADIATETGVSATALMWANSIGDPQTALPVGIAIKVPPKGTMLHRVKETDTLEGIARAYRVTISDITSYPSNNVQQSSDLVAGTYLLIPTENLPVRDHTIFYQVRPGDSLWKINQLYGLTKPTTVVWANNLPDNWVLKPAQIIAIPPTDGVVYVTQDVDTQRNIDDATTQIAKNFACAAVPCNAPPTDERVAQLRDAIFAFGPNGLTHGGRLVKGQEIIIPGGIPYVEPPPVIIPPAPIIDNPISVAPAAPVSGAPPRVRTAAPAQAPAPAVGFPGQYASNYYPAQSYSCSGRNPGFVWPEGGIITSNFTGSHNGIDIAAASNTPLVAVQAGWVVYAGWTASGLGYAVYVDHGNGFVTVYGHMWSVAVRVGQRVSRGQYLGPEGSTGNSTGPHIHFMVIDNGRSCNPFTYLP